MTGLTPVNKQKVNRLIALFFACVLLLLVYGPMAQWFVAADRVLYDNLATHVPSKPLDDTVIISIDPSEVGQENVLDSYAAIMSILVASSAERIILTEPPEIASDAALPGWAVAMSSEKKVYVPTRHRFADLATRDGFLQFQADSDGVLRRASLWLLHDGVMSPSLPLAIAFDNENAMNSHRMSSAEDAIFTSSYKPLPRLDYNDVISQRVSADEFDGKTVFVDSSPELVAAEALLPSGQFVTISEVTASLLADVEQDRTIFAPSWVSAMQWLAPVLLAIVAVLFMPDRTRKDIAVLTGVAVVVLLLTETLLLYLLHVRIDLGRPMIIFVGVSMLTLWLVGDEKKEVRDAFKKGADFLAAGHLPLAVAGGGTHPERDDGQDGGGTAPDSFTHEDSSDDSCAAACGCCGQSTEGLAESGRHG